MIAKFIKETDPENELDLEKIIDDEMAEMIVKSMVDNDENLFDNLI